MLGVILPDRALGRKSQCGAENQNGGERKIAVDTSHLRFSKTGLFPKEVFTRPRKSTPSRTRMLPPRRVPTRTAA